MNHSTELLNVLKRQLKAQGKTYADVATVLEVSEATVKRLFAEGSFTLSRLDKVLALLGIDLTELVELMQRKHKPVACLTEEQEASIAKDVELLLVAVSVINGYSFHDLQQYYVLSEHQLIQKLAILDRLKMIDLLPGNRIKLLIAPHFRWLANGPIQTFFLHYVAKDFFNSRFNQEGEKLLVINGLCTISGNREIQQRMEKFVDEINQLTQAERASPLAEKHGNTLVLALRKWQYGPFSSYLRDDVNV